MNWTFLDIDAFRDPTLLFLLIPVFLLLLAEWFARPHGVIRISTGSEIGELPRNHSEGLRRVPTVLRALGLALLILALARPLTGMRPRVESAEVRDIMLAVDVSGSMTAKDFRIDNKPEDRLFVTKLAVRDFIDSRKVDIGDRFGMDRVGLLLYASYAWIQTPLTLDYALLEHDLKNVYIDQNDEKHNRTAIGSAVGLSLNNLMKSEAESKVIILLTDGINNAGALDPLTAAELANERGIRVYTIGAGATSRSTFSGQNPIDEETLQKIAETTGGKYYRATDLETLREAYREINELETTEIELGEVYDYDEGFLPYAIFGTALVLCSVLMRRQWFEAIP